MNGGLRGSLAATGEALRKIGFFLILVAGSAALGFLIAWPLWLLATTQRKAYTLLVLALAAAGIVFVAVRSILRARRTRRDPGRPMRSALRALLAVLIALVAVSGLYALLVLCVRGIWIFAVPGALLWIGILWLLGRARGALNPRKHRRISAENGIE